MQSIGETSKMTFTFLTNKIGYNSHLFSLPSPLKKKKKKKKKSSDIMTFMPK